MKPKGTSAKLRAAHELSERILSALTDDGSAPIPMKVTVRENGTVEMVFGVSYKLKDIGLGNIPFAFTKAQETATEVLRVTESAGIPGPRCADLSVDGWATLTWKVATDE